jgi:hypothetical protein
MKRRSKSNQKRRRRTRRIRQKGAARNIDRIIYTFWTGKNKIPSNRQECLDDLIANCGCKVQVVNPDNLKSFLLPDEPLHPGYDYLSEVHRSDYLRCYFMHFKGGGYSDMKATTGDWNKAFDDMNANDTVLINSYHEPGPEGVHGGEHAKSLWKELPGTCAFIMPPKTEFTKEWYTKMIAVMDAKLEQLKANPATDPRATPEKQPGYPIAWTELLADIFHPLSCNYRDRFLFTTPIPNLSKKWNE